LLLNFYHDLISDIIGIKVDYEMMKTILYFFTLTFLLALMSDNKVFDFRKGAEIGAWQIEDDVVMGGRSSGHITINEEGHGKFWGNVSLENNGGFSQTKYIFDPISVRNYSKIILRIKGDGKRYQFRIKPDPSQRHAYIQYFETNGEWQDIELQLNTFKPTFRGRELEMENFNASSIQQIAFLIGNKENQNFELLIDKIELE
jgi:hypothetical protein